MGDKPSRENAEAAARALRTSAAAKAARGDADGARQTLEKADLADHLLKGQHDQNES